LPEKLKFWEPENSRPSGAAGFWSWFSLQGLQFLTVGRRFSGLFQVKIFSRTFRDWKQIRFLGKYKNPEYKTLAHPVLPRRAGKECRRGRIEKCYS
jgi:hypothetical protein